MLQSTNFVYCQYDGANLTIFLNGVQDAQGAVTGDTGVPDSNDTITVGIADRGGNFDRPGDLQVKDVRIYNRAHGAGFAWNLYSPETRWDLYHQPGKVLYFLPPVVAGFVPYPRYALTGGMQTMNGGV